MLLSFLFLSNSLRTFVFVQQYNVECYLSYSLIIAKVKTTNCNFIIRIKFEQNVVRTKNGSVFFVQIKHHLTYYIKLCTMIEWVVKVIFLLAIISVYVHWVGLWIFSSNTRKCWWWECEAAVEVVDGDWEAVLDLSTIPFRL